MVRWFKEGSEDWTNDQWYQYTHTNQLTDPKFQYDPENNPEDKKLDDDFVKLAFEDDPEHPNKRIDIVSDTGSRVVSIDDGEGTKKMMDFDEMMLDDLITLRDHQEVRDETLIKQTMREGFTVKYEKDQDAQLFDYVNGGTYFSDKAKAMANPDHTTEQTNYEGMELQPDETNLGSRADTDMYGIFDTNIAAMKEEHENLPSDDRNFKLDEFLKGDDVVLNLGGLDEPKQDKQL